MLCDAEFIGRDALSGHVGNEPHWCWELSESNCSDYYVAHAVATNATEECAAGCMLCAWDASGGVCAGDSVHYNCTVTDTTSRGRLHQTEIIILSFGAGVVLVISFLLCL